MKKYFNQDDINFFKITAGVGILAMVAVIIFL